MTNNYDIVAELRTRHANVTGNDPRITQPIVGPTVFLEAADEIERLRGMLEVQNEMVRHYLLERDEARREVCTLKYWNFNGALDPRGYATLRKWDCFKEQP